MQRTMTPACLKATCGQRGGWQWLERSRFSHKGLEYLRIILDFRRTNRLQMETDGRSHVRQRLFVGFALPDDSPAHAQGKRRVTVRMLLHDDLERLHRLSVAQAAGPAREFVAAPPYGPRVGTAVSIGCASGTKTVSCSGENPATRPVSSSTRAMMVDIETIWNVCVSVV